MQTGSCYPPTGVERYGNRPDGKLSAPPAGRRSVRAVNDLIASFDWLSVRKDEAYPVFTKASTNSKFPWPVKLQRTTYNMATTGRRPIAGC